MNYDNCPICGNGLETLGFIKGFGYIEACKNNCYSKYAHFTAIFDEKVSSEDLEEKIKYWKENDRYLAKIMGA